MPTQDYNVFQPTVWSQRIAFHFRSKLKAARFFSDYSDEVMDGGDVIRIPHIDDSFTASDILTTSGDIVGTSINDTKTDLSINSWKGAALIFSDFQVAQVRNSYRLKDRYAEEMGWKIAKIFDVELLKQGVNISPRVGDSASRLVATNIETAFGILVSNSIPKEECILFLHPKTYYGAIMNIQKYYDASQFGKKSLPMGVHDLLFGVRVVLTENIPIADGTGGDEGGNAYRNLLIHENAIIYAFGNLEGKSPSGVRLSEMKGESLRTKVIADIMYGLKTLRAGAGVRLIDRKV